MNENNQEYLYELKSCLLTETEKKYLYPIPALLPQGYKLQAQVNLASIINRTDNCKFCNELYRNIDACIFDSTYRPIALIEINDSSHETNNRKDRDRKVFNICEEAGIPLINFWTKYDVNTEYMQKKILEAIEKSKNPIRVKHSETKQDESENKEQSSQNKADSSKSGCYVATCVYGSYDCPEVWILRRFRDCTLSKSIFGRAFIKIYYAISPTLVKWFGNTGFFKNLCKKPLDRMVKSLKNKGVSDTRYYD